MAGGGGGGPDYGAVTAQLREDSEKLLQEQRQRSAVQAERTQEFRAESEKDFQRFTRQLGRSIRRDLRLDRRQNAVLEGFMSQLVDFQQQETRRAEQLRQTQRNTLLGLERSENRLLAGTLGLQQALGQEQLRALGAQGRIQIQAQQAQRNVLQRQTGLQQQVVAEQERLDQLAQNRLQTTRLQQGIQQRQGQERARAGFLSAQRTRQRADELRDLRRNL